MSDFAYHFRVNATLAPALNDTLVTASFQTDNPFRAADLVATSLGTTVVYRDGAFIFPAPSDKPFPVEVVGDLVLMSNGGLAPLDLKSFFVPSSFRGYGVLGGVIVRVRERPHLKPYVLSLLPAPETSSVLDTAAPNSKKVLR